MRVLVTGATGVVGGALLPALLERGHDVLALVGDRGRYDGPGGVELVEGDLLDPPVEFPEVDAAYYLPHSIGSVDGFTARDRLAARTFVDAADAAGVDRAIYLGGLEEIGAKRSGQDRPRREIEHLLETGPFDLTTIRSAPIIGDGSAAFDLLTQLAERSSAVVTAGWIDTQCQPIFIDDVVAYLVGILETPETARRAFKIGGQDVLTYREMLDRTAAALSEGSPYIIPIPVASPWVSALCLRLSTDVSPAVARSLVAELEHPAVDSGIDDHVSVELTPFADAVRSVFADREAS